MAMVNETMRVVEKSIGKINPFYDMHIANVNDLYASSANPFDLICNSFRFGYMQGTKAAKAEMKKAGVA